MKCVGNVLDKKRKENESLSKSIERFFEMSRPAPLGEGVEGGGGDQAMLSETQTTEHNRGSD